MTEQDAAQELYALIAEARTLYLRDVVTGSKQYHRYAEDFVNSHRYIDCDRAACRNCHEMNIHILKGMLHDCAHLIQPLFAATDFSFEKCMEVKQTYDTFSPPVPPVTPRDPEIPWERPLSLECNLTRKQMISITACANAYHLFCVSDVRVEDMEALFACRKGFSIRVNKLRLVAILFNSLLEHSLIRYEWQSTLETGRLLVRKSGKGFVSQSNLSSSLTALRKKMTSAAYGIQLAVDELAK